MAKRKEKEEAIRLRLQGMSYSQIRKIIPVSKSSLSMWLEKYPLSIDRLRELRDHSQVRIEKCRETKIKKREVRQLGVYKKVSENIGDLTKRELMLAGFFLYWGEGTKSSGCTVMLSNTDPDVLKLFIQWLKLFDITNDRIVIKLHIYKDMNPSTSVQYWSEQLYIPPKQFNKPTIKHSNLCDITYKNGFGHGTCHVQVFSRDLKEYILMGLKYIREITAKNCARSSIG